MKKALGDTQGPVIHVADMVEQLSSWDELYLSVSKVSKGCRYINSSSRHVVKDMTDKWTNMSLLTLSEDGCVISKNNNLENYTMNIK